MQVEAKSNCLIRLTQGLFTEVDAEDVKWISRYKWYAKRNTSKSEEFGKYYAARGKRVDGTTITIYMHRQIVGCPEDKEVDHKSGNSLCNKRENLRICTRSQHNSYRESRGI